MSTKTYNPNDCTVMINGERLEGVDDQMVTIKIKRPIFYAIKEWWAILKFSRAAYRNREFTFTMKLKKGHMSARGDILK